MMNLLILTAGANDTFACTLLEWLPIFTQPETVQILLDCWPFQREHRGVKLYLLFLRP